MTKTKKQLIACPGYAFIGMKPRYGDFEGQIAIPGTARSKATTGRIGVVCSVNPYPEGRNSLIFESGELVSRPAWRMNDWYTSLLEKYVICRNATHAWGSLYTVRLEFIESEACAEVEPKEDEVERCLRCRSQGEANILLGQDGFCPVCGMNKYGEHIDELDLRSIFANDDNLYDNMIRVPAELQHLLNGGGAIKGNPTSYAGQKSKKSIKKAQLNEHYRRLLEGK